MSGTDDADALPDAVLLQRSRAGDRCAFSELWRRHAPTAVAYARSLGIAPPDPEDVVSDAFLSILQVVRGGGGPEERFRPYLLTAVRNTWLTAARRTPSTVPIELVEDPPSHTGTIDVEAMVDSTALSEAFRSLPERWQHALWLSEVERLPPREIADVLGLRANAVAALTYRAREGLRKAWITAQLRRAPEGSDHARVIELLGGYVQGALGPRPQKVVAEHLASCAACRAAAGEARHLARAITVGPLLVGGAGLVIAPAYFGAGQAAAAAGLAAPLLWPVAATVAVALSVSGGLLLRIPAEPDATGVDVPAVALPPVPPSAEPLPPTPDPVPRKAGTLPSVGSPDDTAPNVDGANGEVPVPISEVAAPAPAPAPAPAAEPEGQPEVAPGAEDPAPTTFLARSRAWWIDVALAPAATSGCPPVATATIRGMAGTVILIVVDGRSTGVTATVGADGSWTGDIALTALSGRHTVTIFDTASPGGFGEQIAESIIEY
ncbi:RNA polymerase sigma factor [Microbacterium sp. EST19A]|uniref:RNA polymerase sigma factor n=1 Tax=Microbacterium sp. EST19A TaxID=2862681 RepID=UPI001CBCA6AD|nr:sigma-70 family RNA polymerase sigma factor [Microbacterium sp. EST19A]